MPVLATRYRIPLTAALRNDDGTACAKDGDQDSGNWGLSANPTSEIAQGAAAAPGATGFIQFVMPANYIPGSAFNVVVAMLDSEGLAGDELVGKSVSVQADSIPADGWDDSSGQLVTATSQDVSSGAYTEYTFPTDGAGVAALEPGDLIAITAGATWTTVTTPSVPVLLNVFVDLNPS